MPGGHGGPRGGASEKRCGKRKSTGGMWSGLRARCIRDALPEESRSLRNTRV